MGTQEDKQIASEADSLKSLIRALRMQIEALNLTNRTLLNINNRVIDFVDDVTDKTLTKEEAFDKIAKAIDSPLFKEV
jgi:hypothetical protein